MLLLHTQNINHEIKAFITYTIHFDPGMYIDAFNSTPSYTHNSSYEVSWGVQPPGILTMPALHKKALKDTEKAYIYVELGKMI